MRFEFYCSTRIIFGNDAVREVLPTACEFGRHPLLVIGKNHSRAVPLQTLLEKEGFRTTLFQVTAEPTLQLVVRGREVACEAKCDFIIGMGGGSVIDAGKAISALLTNEGDLFNYLEVIGLGLPIDRPAAPYIAIPTTAGTGAEVTRNAVLSSPEHRVKVSLRSPLMMPRVAIVDPNLTHSMPPAVTASTGLDALTQVMEPFVSRFSNPLTDSLCREAVKRVARSLRRACESNSDGKAREDMALASLFGGLALANAGLGAVHGLAGPLGGIVQAPHGVICARLLPHVMEVNIEVMRLRGGFSGVLARYRELAQILTQDPGATLDSGITWIHRLCKDLDIPSLTQYGLDPTTIPVVVEKAINASSMKGNPLELSQNHLTEILERAS